MNRNGKQRHSCKYCTSARRPRTVDEARGSRSFRIVYCPRCYTITAAWERVGRCLSPVPVDALITEQITMLDLGEVIAPGRRSPETMDMDSYRVDNSARVEGVPISMPLKVS